MTFETSEQLAAAGAEWMKILRLGEWDVTFALKRTSQMSQSTRLGETAWRANHRKAHVSVLDKIDADELDKENDQEQVLVHELLHLRLADLDVTFRPEADSPLSNVFDQQIELVVDSVAAAMVRLLRSEAS